MSVMVGLWCYSITEHGAEDPGLSARVVLGYPEDLTLSF